MLKEEFKITPKEIELNFIPIDLEKELVKEGFGINDKPEVNTQPVKQQYKNVVNWSQIINDNGNKPANKADVTSENAQAASWLTDGGVLATKNTVSTALLDNLAVTADKLATAAVETAKLNDLAITGAKIAASAITSSKIAALAVTAGKIAANAVTATEINVSQLSAISADIGTVTAGTITGVTVQTSASANTGVKMTAGGGLDIYGQSLEFRNTSGGLVGRISGDGANFNFNTDDGAGKIYFNATGGIVSDGVVQGDGFTTGVGTGQIIAKSSAGASIFKAPSTTGGTTVYLADISITNHIIPDSDGWSEIGSSSYGYKSIYLTDTGNLYVNNIVSTSGVGLSINVHNDEVSIESGGNLTLYGGDLNVQGMIQTDSLRIDQTPTAETPTPTHTFTINLNGTVYRVPCLV